MPAERIKKRMGAETSVVVIEMSAGSESGAEDVTISMTDRDAGAVIQEAWNSHKAFVDALAKDSTLTRKHGNLVACMEELGRQLRSSGITAAVEKSQPVD